MKIAMLSMGVKLRNQECLQNVEDLLYFYLTFLSLFSFKTTIFSEEMNRRKLVKNIETKIITFTHFTIRIFISLSFKLKQLSAKIIKVRKDRAQSSILAQDMETHNVMFFSSVCKYVLMLYFHF